MGSVPTADPSPLRPWRLSRRVVPLAILGLAAVALVVVGAAVVWPSSPDESVNVGQARSLETEVPAPFEDFYVVKLQSGEIIALSRTDPHEVFGEKRDCPITWRPDMQFSGTTGWFRGTCSGSTFDLTGILSFGPSPRNMDRFVVHVRGDGSVAFDTSRRLCAPDYTAVACP